ncbi:MAG: DUF4340 domain-containing protein [Polyangiales bacterium]
MRSVVVHAVLAALALVWAYEVWTDDSASDKDLGEVTVLQCDKNSIKRVQYRAPEKEVTVKPTRVDGETKIWIDSHSKPKKGKASRKSFVGNEEAENFLKQMTPMHALRALGTIGKKKKKAFELDKAKTYLDVECGRKKRSYRIGGTAYGSGDRYIQDKQGGKVYLVHADLLAALQSAEFRLKQRELHTFEATEVHQLQVEAFGRKVTLLQRNRRVPEKATWVDASKPDKINELYGNWLSRVGQLRAQDYLKAKAVPGSELKKLTESVSPTPVLKLRYEEEDGDELGTLEMVRVDAETPSYYAKSEVTERWVTVPKSVAEQVASDVRPVVGLEALAKPATKKAPAAPAPNPHAAPGSAGAPAPGGPPAASPGGTPAPHAH